MAVSIKHLNSDSSFLLSFEPVLPPSVPLGTLKPQPFTILLDPWITGSSKLFHSKISSSTHKQPACITNLSELPEPDLVIISQQKSAHCNEATLRQLPPRGTKTMIYAEASAARSIKSWRYFEKGKVQALEKWEDPRVSGRYTTARIMVPPLGPGGQPGEVTIAFIPQKRRDLANMHGAIGITYRPPSIDILPFSTRIQTAQISPPKTPESGSSSGSPVMSEVSTASSYQDSFRSSISPRSLRSSQSLATLVSAGSRSRTSFAQARHGRILGSLSSFSRPLSIVFSPHGSSYTDLAPYVTSHLVNEAALPLTALLHCMDSVSGPRWLGGNIASGTEAGAEIATQLSARVWVSAGDGEKDTRGLATKLWRTQRFRQEQVEQLLRPVTAVGTKFGSHGVTRARGHAGTDAMRLASGEEVVISGDGMVWRSETEAIPQVANAPPKDYLSPKLSFDFSRLELMSPDEFLFHAKSAIAPLRSKPPPAISEQNELSAEVMRGMV